MRLTCSVLLALFALCSATLLAASALPRSLAENQQATRLRTSSNSCVWCDSLELYYHGCGEPWADCLSPCWSGGGCRDVNKEWPPVSYFNYGCNPWEGSEGAYAGYGRVLRDSVQKRWARRDIRWFFAYPIALQWGPVDDVLVEITMSPQAGYPSGDIAVCATTCWDSETSNSALFEGVGKVLGIVPGPTQPLDVRTLHISPDYLALDGNTCLAFKLVDDTENSDSALVSIDDVYMGTGVPTFDPLICVR